MSADNTAIVRHFIRNWQQMAKPRGQDDAFYEILKDFDATALAPGAESTIGIVGETEQESRLVKLWEGWAMFFAGQEAQALAIFKVVAKSLPERPEPRIFLGVAAILQTEKKTAVAHLTDAKKLAPDIEPLTHLLAQFGTRNRPVIPFLHRDNPLNVALGKIRHKQRLKR